MRRGIVFASSSRNKYEEIRAMLDSSGVDLFFGPDILPPGQTLDVIEDAPSYAGNAIKKALAWSGNLGIPALADDSGLEVRSLEWGPGAISARVAADDQGRIGWLLKRLEGISDRSGRFVAVLALCYAGGRIFMAEGFCPGSISHVPSGKSGFGYDPVFVPDGYKKTFAELGPDVKSRISHRAVAAEALSHMLGEKCMIEYIFASRQELSGRCSG